MVVTEGEGVLAVVSVEAAEVAVAEVELAEERLEEVDREEDQEEAVVATVVVVEMHGAESGPAVANIANSTASE